jgi:DNA (cytosine-5)-methyltransferase 1
MTLNTSLVHTVENSSQSSYLDTLEQAWQQHLAPRLPDAPTIISLFAGCGGSSLGYSMAGFRELLAVEWNDNAVETFRLNFPDVPVYHGDIAQLSVEECLRLTSLQVGELDVLDGSPPCQGFSTAGKRLMDDPRNQLFREYVRLLRGLQPKVLIMENVSGMVKGKMKLIFADILRELKASGYQVRAWLMNAMYFNVPQSRQRLIFIGVRDDLGIVLHELKPQSRPIVVKQAWQALPKLNHEWAIVRQDSKTYKRLLNAIPGKKIEGFSLAKRLSFTKVAGTIQGGAEYTATYPCSSWPAHPLEMRGISIREAARLSSYPDNFEFIGILKEQTKRLGNSVPPLFMRAIARHVNETILQPISISDL